MEVWRLTGETISAHDERTRALPPRWDSLRVALSFAERERLYARIDTRVDAMLRAGLADEVRELLRAGLSPDSTAMQAIGYKEIVAFLRGDCTQAEAVGTVKRESRRYAKRQLTWLRRDRALHWILWEGEPEISAAAARVRSLWTGGENLSWNH